VSADRSWADSEYSRIYHAIVKRMGADYDDDAFVGSWTKLLLSADALYPTPTPLPRWLSDEMLERLLRSGLVRRVGAGGYAMAGLDKERASRDGGRRAGGLARVEKSNERDEHGRFVRTQPDDGSEASSKPSNVGSNGLDRESPSRSPWGSVAGLQQESSKPSNGPAISPAAPAKSETESKSETETEGDRDSGHTPQPPGRAGGLPRTANDDAPPAATGRRRREPIAFWPGGGAPMPATVEGMEANRLALKQANIKSDDPRHRRAEARLRSLERSNR
jgi:hypothetical protein